ncbi:MAG: hypothetical protein JWM80_1749, partial [Cyanobacteria bacterium RYN_339]|nr:hypothetical protein [Cyanobacteria bacterium RYN_339]
MKTSPWKPNVRIALWLAPIVAAGCMGTPATSTAPAPGTAPQTGGGGGTVITPDLPLAALAPTAMPAPQTATPGQQLQKEVTLRVDPETGTISAAGSYAALAVIQTQLAIDFDAVNLSQTGDTTTFMLDLRNHGSAVVDLQLGFGGDKQPTSPTGKVAMGAMPAGAEAQQQLTFNNPGGKAFNVTVTLWATLEASGDVSTTGATPVPTATPVATPTPAPGGGGSGGGGTTSTPTPTPAPTAT